MAAAAWLRVSVACSWPDPIDLGLPRAGRVIAAARFTRTQTRDRWARDNEGSHNSLVIGVVVRPSFGVSSTARGPPWAEFDPLNDTIPTFS